jgi:hypothetical protein
MASAMFKLAGRNDGLRMRMIVTRADTTPRASERAHSQRHAKPFPLKIVSRFRPAWLDVLRDPR